MKIYLVEESGSSSMGFPTMEKFFQLEVDANKLFDEKIEKYKEMDELDDDVEDPITIDILPSDIGRKILREANVSVWDSFMTDCGEEFDRGLIQLKIVEIEVE